jgi:hypothetical protein
MKSFKHNLIFKERLEERIKLLPVSQKLKADILRKIAAEFARLDQPNTT